MRTMRSLLRRGWQHGIHIRKSLDLRKERIAIRMGDGYRPHPEAKRLASAQRYEVALLPASMVPLQQHGQEPPYGGRHDSAARLCVRQRCTPLKKNTMARGIVNLLKIAPRRLSLEDM